MSDTAAIAITPLDELLAALDDIAWSAGRCTKCLVSRDEEHRSYCAMGRALKAAVSLRSSAPAPAPRRPAKKAAPLPRTAGRAAAEPHRLQPLLSSASREWGTPRWLFELLHARHGFRRDVCATADNALLPTFWSPADDALRQEWTADGGPYYMNPPYGTFEAACDAATCRKKSCAKRGHHLTEDLPGIDAWMRKAREAALAGATVVCLVPARVDTAWWQDSVFGESGQRYGVTVRSGYVEQAPTGEQLEGFLEEIVSERLHVRILFVRSRLRFEPRDGEKAESAPFPSALVTFSPPRSP